MDEPNVNMEVDAIGHDDFIDAQDDREQSQCQDRGLNGVIVEQSKDGQLSIVER